MEERVISGSTRRLRLRVERDEGGKGRDKEEEH